MIVKRIIALILLIIFILMVFFAGWLYYAINSFNQVSIPSPSVELVEGKSYYNDFEVVNDSEVLITGEVTLRNDASEDMIVYLVGSFPYDFHSGLLKNGTLYAKDIETDSMEFTIPAKGEVQFSIVFEGVYGGVYQKHDRLLPDITIIPKE